jgi:hypothetical protein
VGRGRRGRQAAIQLLKRSPVNPRRLLGVPKLPHTKGVALIASGLARLERLEPGAGHGAEAVRLMREVGGRAIPSGEGIGWGYDFDVQTRWGTYRRGEANAIVSTFVANAMLDAAEAADAPDLRELAGGVVRYANSSLLVSSPGRTYYGYFAGAERPIHNASVLVAALIARCGDDADVALAAPAVAWSVSRQAPDGSWAYGEDPGLEWVDGYHTAFILEGLRRWTERSDDPPARAALERGLAFYLDALFDPDGAPRATVDSRFPVDIHGASTAIGVLASLQALHPEALPTAERVLTWTLANLRRRDGRYAFQLHRRYRNSTAYIRWNDGHMLLALSELALRHDR